MKGSVAFFPSCAAARAVKLRVKIVACLACLAVAVPTGLALSLPVFIGPGLVTACIHLSWFSYCPFLWCLVLEIQSSRVLVFFDLMCFFLL